MAEEKKKICPLSYTVGKGSYAQGVDDFDYCVKERCAWWDDFTGHCAILNISRRGALGSFDVIKKETKGD